jgi:hypothetical protein
MKIAALMCALMNFINVVCLNCVKYLFNILDLKYTFVLENYNKICKIHEICAPIANLFACIICIVYCDVLNEFQYCYMKGPVYLYAHIVCVYATDRRAWSGEAR